ncbi:hypothetical protein [Sulfuricurvum sp.]|uniref:hypothetical protein n=1 Tax=Sulfuricurvum sp. TaxID=2025608 RepID=UPI0035678E93
MPKAQDKKEKVDKSEGLVPDIPIFKNPSNAPELEIPPEKLQSILEYFCVGDEFAVVAIECEDEIQVCTRNATNNVSGHFIGLPADTKVKKPGYFIVEPKKLTSLLGTKYKGSNMITLTWKPNEKIHIEDEKGNPTNITPKSLGNLIIPPLDRRFTFKEKKLQFNIKKGKETVLDEATGKPATENAKTSLNIDQAELLKGANDMSVSDVDYIIYHIDEENGYCISGIWNPKGDDSRTDGLVFEDFEGEKIEKAMPKIFVDLVKRMSGKINIQSTQEKPVFALSQWVEDGEIHYTVVESKQKKD